LLYMLIYFVHFKSKIVKSCVFLLCIYYMAV